MAKKQKKLDDISKKFGDEREKALNDALKLIEKDFGKGSIMRLGERAEQKVQVLLDATQAEAPDTTAAPSTAFVDE